jgi:hypothetical protein
MHSPAKDTEDEIEHEEAAHHDEGDEEDPVEHAPHRVVGLNAIHKNVSEHIFYYIFLLRSCKL